LWLDGNQLTALPPEVAELTSLQKLTLDGNQLTALPRQLADLLSLVVG
jgi:Leucine-rich repeat (LRR) protein